MNVFQKFNGNRNELSSDKPIEIEELREFAPSIFKNHPHESRSAKYTHVPTIDVHNAMVGEGFKPYRVVQQRARPKGRTPEALAEATERTGFKKHLIMYRHPDADGVARNGVGEVGFVGSHDGGCAVFLFSGWFEFLCANGLVLGEVGRSVTIPHKGDVVSLVLEEAHNVMASLGPVADWMKQLKEIEIDRRVERLQFASEALALRWKPEETPIYPEQLLESRRLGETTTNLWGLYNVVEENLRRGGLTPVAEADRRKKHGSALSAIGRTRPLRLTGAVRSIDGSMSLERKLCALAETWRQRLAA